MKIQIGHLFTGDCGKKSPLPMGLNIPGVGVIEAKLDEDDLPFSCVVLDKEQILRLREAIDLELTADLIKRAKKEKAIEQMQKSIDSLPYESIIPFPYCAICFEKLTQDNILEKDGELWDVCLECEDK